MRAVLEWSVDYDCEKEGMSSTPVGQSVYDFYGFRMFMTVDLKAKSGNGRVFTDDLGNEELIIIDVMDGLDVGYTAVNSYSATQSYISPILFPTKCYT